MKRLLFVLPIVCLLFVSCSEEEVDNIAPVIDVVIVGFPLESSGLATIVSNQVEIVIDAKDAGGIQKIEAFIDEVKVGEDLVAPYKLIIDVSNLKSKNSTSGSYKNYNLKVTATDNSGNSTSFDRILNVDNSLPIISKVSLDNEVVISGAENLLSFMVVDNKELKNVMVTVNNTELETVGEESVYTSNINTMLLSDGSNTINIKAEDAAGNIAVFVLSFLVDNSGPEITMDVIEEGKIVDGIIQFEPSVLDEYSEVVSVQLSYEGVVLANFTSDVESFSIDFDPEEFPTGKGKIEIVAQDTFGNESVFEVSIDIYRKLLTLNVPQSYLSLSEFTQFFIFASSIDGAVLDTQEVGYNTQQIVLRTTVDVQDETPFSISLATRFNGSFGDASELTTISDLKRGVNKELNLVLQPWFVNENVTNVECPLTGFDPNQRMFIDAGGFGYEGSFYEDSNLFNMEELVNRSTDVNSDRLYVTMMDLDLNEFSAVILDKGLTSDYVFSPDVFSTEGIERKYMKLLNTGEQLNNAFIFLKGYFSNADFENNVFHRISGFHGVNQHVQSLPYFFDNRFENYICVTKFDNYYTQRVGIPEESLTKLNWDVDYSFQNNQISINKTGSGHQVGKIFIDSNSPVVINGYNVSYRWSIVFDSVTTDTVILPQIPDEIKSWGFYQLYESNELRLVQVELKRYEGLTSFQDYFDQVIKNNKLSYLVSPVIEAVFKSDDQNYYNRAPHYLLD